MQSVMVNRRVGFTVPGAPPAKPLIDIGNGASADLGDAAVVHHPIRVQAMHVHVALSPSLKLNAVVADARMPLPKTGTGELAKVLVVVDLHAATLQNDAIPLR